MKVAVAMVLTMLAGCRIDFDEREPTDAAGTSAAIAAVQHNGSWGNIGTTSVTLPFSNPLEAHDAVLVMLHLNTVSVALTSVTDTLGNVYTPVFGPTDDANFRAYFVVGLDVMPGATSVTAFFDAPPNVAGELFIAEYRGIALANAFDEAQAGAGGNFGVDAMQSGAMTTHGARELLYGYGRAPCVQAGTGFSVQIDVHGDITEDLIVDAGQHQITATSGCPNPGDRWQMLGAALRPQLLP